MLRFYADSIHQPETILTGTEAHHLASVMRLGPGERVELFDGRGALAAAVITKASNRRVILSIEQIDFYSEPEKPGVTIAASIAKGERFDWLIARCTELGVDRIVPVIFERTVKQPKNPKILDRWNNIAISSSKQCKRLILPKIDKALSLTEVIKANSDSLLLVGSLDEQAQPLVNMEIPDSDIIAFVGPEGGLTVDEAQLLQQHNARPVRLTDTVLRIETAAVAFASILTARRDALPAG